VNQVVTLQVHPNTVRRNAVIHQLLNWRRQDDIEASYWSWFGGHAVTIEPSSTDLVIDQPFEVSIRDATRVDARKARLDSVLAHRALR
jgi:hypothetical protein